MSTQKKIVLVAHDEKKQDLLAWARFNQALLKQHELSATGTTGTLVESLKCWVSSHHRPLW
jgi:methylglyoxal synthase